MKMNIEPGMRFRYTNKSGERFFGTVETVMAFSDGPAFVSTKGLIYRASEVEWVDELRDQAIDNILS